MKNLKVIFTSIGQICLLLIVMWVTILVLSFSPVFVKSYNYIDTATVQQTIYRIPRRLLSLGLYKLHDTKGKNMVILGASGARAGLRPPEINAGLPDFNIHNLCLGAANMTQIKEVFDDVAEYLSEEQLKNTCFVFGLSHVNFAPVRMVYSSGQTELTKVKLQTGLYALKEGKVVLKFRKEFLPYFTFFMRPFWLIERYTKAVVFEYKDRIMLFLQDWLRRGDFSIDTLFGKEESFEVNNEFKKSVFTRWDDYMGNSGGKIDQAQWQVFLNLLNKAKDLGSSVVVVNMPLPEWHRKQSSYYDSYFNGLQKLLVANNGYKNVSFIDMQVIDREEDFRDSSHPKPENTKKWADFFTTQFKNKQLGLTLKGNR